MVRGNMMEDVKGMLEVFWVDKLDDLFGLKGEEMEVCY